MGTMCGGGSQQRQALSRRRGLHVRRQAFDQFIDCYRIHRQHGPTLAGGGPQVVPAVLRVSVNVQIHAYLDFWNNSGWATMTSFRRARVMATFNRRSSNTKPVPRERTNDKIMISRSPP